MRYLSLCLLASLCLIACQPEPTPPPNIVVFIADDVSWNDLGCYGNTEVKTPNIDRIAAEGLRFNQAYLTASSCSPSRISIMTGRYPHNTGAPELHTQPRIALASIASQLKTQGYYTAQAGKWHMGDLLREGYDRIEDEFQKDKSGGEAKWLEVTQQREKDKPFFFWFAAYDAHRIWGEDNQFIGTHNADSLTAKPYWVNDKGTRMDMAGYYDEIARFDYYIGEIEKELEAQGVLDNTLIVIMADNGRPFTRAKTRGYDEGMKTPMVMKWPKGIKYKGATSEALLSVIDLAPTFASLAGAETPESFQGKDLSALFKDPSAEFRSYAFAEHNWHDFEAHERMLYTPQFTYIRNFRPQFASPGPADAINSPTYKALEEGLAAGTLTELQAAPLLAPQPREELYDRSKDPLQYTNLIGQAAYQKEHEHFANVLQIFMQQTGDDVPEKLTPSYFDLETGDWLVEFPTFYSKSRELRGTMPGEAKGADTIHEKGPF